MIPEPKQKTKKICAICVICCFYLFGDVGGFLNNNNL